LLFQGKVY